MKPVVIVGAGLAGLTCARVLKRNRIPFFIVEADQRIGGRVKTDVVGNFRLDRGYQAYFTGYPHVKPQLDEDRLQLRRFQPGALVVWDGEQHPVIRDNPLQMALSGYLSTMDKLRFGKWTSDLQWLDWADLAELPDVPAESFLRDTGLSEDFLDRFARPFFGSLFLDRSLSFSSRQLAFVWKSLSEGEIAVPALGMEEIPKQIGATFGPDVLALGARVVDLIVRDDAVAGVRLEDGEVVEAEHVILACDAAQASRLSGIPIPVEFRHSITLYFTADDQPIEGGLIVLNGNMRGITSQVVPISNVNPFSEPIEFHLLSATIHGERPETDEQLAEIVKSEMRLWFPDRGAESWKFLRGYRNQCALMDQRPGFRRHLPHNDSGRPGLYFAGEFTTNSSIDGAMQSGLECAQLILERSTAGAV